MAEMMKKMESNQLLVDYMLGDLELCDHFCLSVCFIMYIEVLYS